MKYISVVMTASYPRSELVSRGSVLKFVVDQSSVGISNLSTLKNTGKFVCEKSGIYMVSVSIMSYTDGARFYIYLNGNVISSTYIGAHTEGWWHTGTVVIARQLQIDDSLWVQTSGLHINHGLDSSFTIVKVK